MQPVNNLLHTYNFTFSIVRFIFENSRHGHTCNISLANQIPLE